MNPWGISESEAKALRSVIKYGCFKRAAQATGKSRRTIEFHVQASRKKILAVQKLSTNVLVVWDRWERRESMSGTPRPDPWGLSPMQTKSITAVIDYGSRPAAAAGLKVAEGTLHSHMDKALRKINAVDLSHTHRLVVWDRWARTAAG